MKLGLTNLDVFPLSLGGNVFGWTANEKDSFAVLDAYTTAGGNFIDTADMYSSWVPGNSGGESETIIGDWMKARRNRDQIVVATKVGKLPGLTGLAPKTIRTAAENSLKRLQIDTIDLYYAHADDQTTPLEETLSAFDALVREGKVRHIAASNYSAQRLEEALTVSDRLGLARYVALQQHYNLVERDLYEGPLANVVANKGLVSIPYYGLASGFLSGKYRPNTKIDSPRSEKAATYLTPLGIRVLEALDQIAVNHSVSIATVALAWLAAQPTVAAPIASARSTNQLKDLVKMADVKLTASEISILNKKSGKCS
jgi:aryl-alcohol dehydrogenase-like predicted oxidoreductase